MNKMILVMVLKEIDELMAGSEKPVTVEGDLSGCLTEWVLDTDKFREKLQQRIRELENGQADGNP